MVVNYGEPQITKTSVHKNEATAIYSKRNNFEQELNKMHCPDCESQGLTKLHSAATLNRQDLVDFLVKEKKYDIKATDKQNRTPLLLAAELSAWKSVNTLIELNADITSKDSEGRNILHLIAIGGGCLSKFEEILVKHKQNNDNFRSELEQLINVQDNKGYTPLHYASECGHIRALMDLIKYGASVSLKNKDQESALHLAARYGRYNSVKCLVKSENGSFTKDEKDGKGMTALQIASQQGHVRVVQLLIEQGALLCVDNKERNPLHQAAISGYTNTIELLYAAHSHLLNQIDCDGNTALHLATIANRKHVVTCLLTLNCELKKNKDEKTAFDYAISCKFEEVVLAMVTHEKRSTHVIEDESNQNPSVIYSLIQSMPKVFKKILDKSITQEQDKDKHNITKYSFEYLSFPSSASEKQRQFLPVLNVIGRRFVYCVGF